MSVTDTSPDVGKHRRIGRADNECGIVKTSHSFHAKCDNPTPLPPYTLCSKPRHPRRRAVASSTPSCQPQRTFSRTSKRPM